MLCKSRLAELIQSKKWRKRFYSSCQGQLTLHEMMMIFMPWASTSHHYREPSFSPLNGFLKVQFWPRGAVKVSRREEKKTSWEGALEYENQLSFSQTLPQKLARTSRQLSIGLFSMGLAHVYAIQLLCKTIYQASFFLFVWVNFVWKAFIFLNSST